MHLEAQIFEGKNERMNERTSAFLLRCYGSSGRYYLFVVVQKTNVRVVREQCPFRPHSFFLGEMHLKTSGQGCDQKLLKEHEATVYEGKATLEKCWTKYPLRHSTG